MTGVRDFKMYPETNRKVEEVPESERREKAKLNRENSVT